MYKEIHGPAGTPNSGEGLYFMDSSSAAAECVTIMAAGGFVIHTFPTGQGNVIGHPIVPVIKNHSVSENNTDYVRTF